MRFCNDGQACYVGSHYLWAAKRILSRFWFILLFVLVAGCGGNENLASVTGTVKLDGEVLPNAFVVFAPTSGGTTSYGRTDASGRYEMMFNDYEKGAWLGENRVEISTGDVDATGSGGAREKVPAIYNQRSNLKVDVASGKNVHDFDLKSDAGRVIQLPPE
ncbi:MAG: carboxypeptidase regulatory-like domain-containing protein [Planctomycetales bacterium]|nr:carboxypeptidase regulatory-like domain-containing protein [Planctomycetales bacterium]